MLNDLPFELMERVDAFLPWRDRFVVRQLSQRWSSLRSVVALDSFDDYIECCNCFLEYSKRQNRHLVVLLPFCLGIPINLSDPSVAATMRKNAHLPEQPFWVKEWKGTTMYFLFRSANR